LSTPAEYGVLKELRITVQIGVAVRVLAREWCVGGLRPMKMRLLRLLSHDALRGMYCWLLSDGDESFGAFEPLFGLASQCVCKRICLERHGGSLRAVEMSHEPHCGLRRGDVELASSGGTVVGSEQGAQVWESVTSNAQKGSQGP
jgi:hypothetical protein